jgi:hypothetical protein
MTRMWMFVLGVAGGIAIIGLPRIVAHLQGSRHGLHAAETMPGSARAHTVEKFGFTANGTMEQVGPLFGAEKERLWAPNWEPQFVYPLPAGDLEGMVFRVAHGHVNAIWVNTEFDLKNGRVGYAYVIPDALVTVIRLKLTPAGNQTRVEVEYERTALSAEADAPVRRMGEGDRTSGPEWEMQVNGYLEKLKRQAG